MTRGRSSRTTAADESISLYHYTSVDVLEKITERKEIWASSVHYLNDGREFAHALELFGSALERALQTNPPCTEYLNKVREQLRQNAWRDVFVVSFSEHGDLLSQWRAYCPAGRGVSIGLRQKDLHVAAAARGFRLVRCKYALISQRDAASRIVRTWTNELDSICSPSIVSSHAVGADTDPEFDIDREYTGDDLVRMFAIEFANVGPQMKDPAFAEEREWRLVGLPSEFNKLEVRYRPGASYLVPYIRFPLPVTEDGRLKLSDLVLGPTPHADLSRRAIINLLASRAVEVGRVRGTTVPFRTW